MADQRKLCDQEFHELIPTLPIEELFLIEVKKGSQWLKFCEFDGKNLVCNVCNLKIFLPSYSSHCTSAKHKENLKSFQRIYHPRLTQPKSPSESVSANYLRALEERAKEKAKSLNAEAQRIFARTLDKKIRLLCLKTNVRDVKQVFVNVGLPLRELIELEYQTNQGDWKQLLTTERLNINSKFFCALCSVYCAGVITVGAHFGGNSHMVLQLGIAGVRHKTYRTLTKNCRFFYNATFVMNVSENGKKFYKDKAEKWFAEVQKQVNLNTSNKDDCAALLLSNDDLSLIDEIQQAVNADDKDKDTKAKSTDSAQKKDAAGKDVDNSLKEGLVGVEYVVKLLKSKSSDVTYECVLCEHVCNEQRMQQHLISHDHRLKYCDMHFADTMKKYKNMVGHMRYQQFYRVMSPLLSKLASAIEGFHSRAVPAAINEDDFLKKRADYLADIYSYRHACQSHGPSFSKIISAEQILEFKKDKDLYKEPMVTSKSSYIFTTVPKRPYLEVFSYNMEDRLERGLSSSGLKSSEPVSRHSGDRDKKHGSRNRSKTPPLRAKKRERSPEKSPETDIWKKYDKEVGIEKKRVEREYSNYRKQPENHPLYEREWNRFWKQRKDELISEGIDHRTYNYQAEWVHYFKNRLEELYCEAVREIKNTIRLRLNIPIDGNREDTRRVVATEHSAAKMPLMMADPFGLQQIQRQQETSAKFQLQQSQFTAIQPRVALAPTVAPMPVPAPVTIQQPISTPVIVKPQYEAPVVDDKPNVIHALRLLTAMEDHLGSLGSKIMDLFSKALQLEKKCNNNSALLEKCVLTSDNCNLLEVAMEKLKGILFAGLLEGNRAQSFNRIIKTTEELLTYAESRGWRNSCTEIEPETQNNTSIELQKLLNVIQNKSSTPLIQQKSLSDTLKQLMSGKTKEREPTTESSPESMNNSRESFNTSLNTSFQNNSSFDYDRLVSNSKTQINPHSKMNDMSLQMHSNRGQMQRSDFNFRNQTIPSSPNPNEMNFGRDSNVSQLNKMQMNRNTQNAPRSNPSADGDMMSFNYSSSTKTAFPNLGNQMRPFNANNNMQMMRGSGNLFGTNNVNRSNPNADTSSMSSGNRDGNMFMNNSYNPNYEPFPKRT